MELIKLLWVVVFFLFSLTLLFVWSKLYIISKKAKAIDSLLSEISTIEEKDAPTAAPNVPDKKPAL